MHVGEVMTADVANGEGMRVSVFVSGCRNHCKGCFQPQTWDFNYGREYTPEIEQFIIDELSKSYYDGITILGGDPMGAGKSGTGIAAASQNQEGASG